MWLNNLWGFKAFWRNKHGHVTCLGNCHTFSIQLHSRKVCFLIFFCNKQDKKTSTRSSESHLHCSWQVCILLMWFIQFILNHWIILCLRTWKMFIGTKYTNVFRDSMNKNHCELSWKILLAKLLVSHFRLNYFQIHYLIITWQKRSKCGEAPLDMNAHEPHIPSNSKWQVLT